MLLETKLLHRAVKRNCQKKADFLLHHVPLGNGGTSLRNSFTFTPNVIGAGNLNPMHLATNIQNCEDLVDWAAFVEFIAGFKWANSPCLCLITCITDWLEEIGRYEKFPGINNNFQERYSFGGGCITRKCWIVRRISGNQGALYCLYMHSMLAISAGSVCVCMMFKVPPQNTSVAPLKYLDIKPHELDVLAIPHAYAPRKNRFYIICLDEVKREYCRKTPKFAHFALVIEVIAVEELLICRAHTQGLNGSSQAKRAARNRAELGWRRQTGNRNGGSRQECVRVLSPPV
eukprot:Gb_36402 [translate_table: standard]